MARSTKLIIVLLALLAGLLGYNYFARPLDRWLAERYPVLPVHPTNTPSPQDQLPPAQAALNQLTPRQRVAQLIAAPIELNQAVPASPSGSEATSLLNLGTSKNAYYLEWLKTQQPGGVTIFGSDISFEQARSAVMDMKQLDQPPLILVDHEGGSVQRLNGPGFTQLPHWQELCAQTATDSARLLDRSALELKAVGVDIVLAPVVDVASANPVLQKRVCSGDPQLLIAKATQFASLFQDQGIVPVLKHFPGIGKTSRDLHTAFDRVEVTQVEAGIYRSLLERFPQAGVMTSHAGVTNQYPDIPCSLSPTCVGEVTKLFPSVLVISDALEMRSAAFQAQAPEPKPLDQVALEAVMAGNQVLVFGPSVQLETLTQLIDQLTADYNRDTTVKAKVDAAALRILEHKVSQTKGP
jgi:beta-N-acetylhexosaminidase